MTIMVRSMSGRTDGTGAGAESIQPEIQPREREEGQKERDWEGDGLLKLLTHLQ